MAGTFYRSPAPGEPPFVRKGDKVTKGQTVAIIEAMKLMNEIEVGDHCCMSAPECYKHRMPAQISGQGRLKSFLS